MRTKKYTPGALRRQLQVSGGGEAKKVSVFTRLLPRTGSFPRTLQSFTPFWEVPCAHHSRPLSANRKNATGRDSQRLPTRALQSVLTDTRTGALFMQYKPLLSHCLGIDTTLDRERIHPPSTCNNCYAKMKKIDAGTTSSTLVPFPFMEHSSNCPLCTYCETQSKGGRPRKVSKIPQNALQHLRENAGPKVACPQVSLSLNRFFQPSPNSVSLEDLQCPFCRCIVDQPVQLPCKAAICMGCLLWVSHRGNNCPYCGDEHDPSSVVSVSTIFNKFLVKLVLQCICEKPVQLEHLRPHIKSGCKEYAVDTPQDLTLQHLLHQPLNTQTTSLEERTAGHLVRKLLLQSDSNTITLPTGGHVSPNYILHRDTKHKCIINTATHSQQNHKSTHQFR